MSDYQSRAIANASGTGLVIGSAGGLLLGAVLGNPGIGLIFGALAGIVFGAGFGSLRLD